MDKKTKMLLSIEIIFIMISMTGISALEGEINTPNKYDITKELPIYHTVTHSDLIVTSKSISSNGLRTVNSIDRGYFNVTISCYVYHGVHRCITKSVLGKVTGNTGGCTIITSQFKYCNLTASNSTGTFKLYSSFVVMKNIGYTGSGSCTYNYVAIAVNAEIYNNGDVFMQYSIAHSQQKSKEYVAFMDITNIIKKVCG